MKVCGSPARCVLASSAGKVTSVADVDDANGTTRRSGHSLRCAHAFTLRPVKIGFATGTWDSELVRDPRWRKIIETIDTGGPAQERLQLARKVLRDGNDVTRSMLFEIFLREQMDTRWGAENPFEPALGASASRRFTSSTARASPAAATTQQRWTSSPSRRSRATSICCYTTSAAPQAPAVSALLPCRRSHKSPRGCGPRRSTTC